MRLAGQRLRDLRSGAVGKGEDGMSTAEYAVGTVAACGFGGVLFKVLTSDTVAGMLRDLVQRALTTSF
jgi:hypothetical protein